MKRDSAAIIFRTVVFAGAMLGAPACSKKPAPATPGQPAAAPTTTGGDHQMQPDASNKPATADDHHDGDADPCGGDPCGGGERPRGSDDDGGGGVGRGFILS